MKFKSAIFALGMALSAGLANAQVIVDTTYVQDAIKRNVQIWDVRASKDFTKAHLPGAKSIDDASTSLRDANAEDFISTEEAEKILGNAGLDPTKETVVYGGRGTWNAYFGRYVIRYFGGSKVTVYHDGIEGWQAVGLPVETGTVKATPIKLTLKTDPSVMLTTKEVLDKLGSETQIVDARTTKEFLGTDIRALRGGNIPGSVNIPYEMNWNDPQTIQKLAKKEVNDTQGMALKDTKALKELYSKLDPNKETVVYCQSGARASETAGVLEQLGFKNVKIYDSSWIGYGNKIDAPANNATVFNVGALNGRITAMQSRIEALEKELASKK